mmetsp:Transcript_15944/g.23657  ORF Transcript_15944/g.23657 Transcript_15944/m.23657 type:complete len:258 (-) Transcript_15944:43-816(-)
MNAMLITAVQKYCSLNDRERLQRLFTEYKEHFAAIPLGASEVSDTQAINDLVRERITLNNVDFFGNTQHFIKALRKVVNIFVEMSPNKSPNRAKEITDKILRQSSRTTSGCDSYFTVQQLFSAEENYLLKPRGFALPPINIEVYLLDGCIHSKVTCTNLYGLYSMTDINSTSYGSVSKKPHAWLSLDTTVVESTNHSTQHSYRVLSIMISPESDQSNRFSNLNGSDLMNDKQPRSLAKGSTFLKKKYSFSPWKLFLM